MTTRVLVQHHEWQQRLPGGASPTATRCAGVCSLRRPCEEGYLLLAIMLMMAFMVITLAYVIAPSLVQQMKRDREEEMIHRGTEYARAIKKFYKKNGRYPTSLDDLDKGQIRYLRKRYTDPLTKDGKWKLLRYGDIQALLNAGAPGTPAGALNQGGILTGGGAVVPGVPSPAAGSSRVGAFGFGSQGQSSTQPVQQQPLQNPGVVAGFAGNSDQGSNPEGVPSNSFGYSSSAGSDQSGSGSDQQGFSGGTQPSGFGSQNGVAGVGQNAGGNQIFGGGAVVGVASLSKEKTIRIYNKKKTYDEWQFIYNPAADQQNVLLRGPYQPTTIGSASIGTPAGQLNAQPQSTSGQQNNGFGQQQSQPQPANSYSH